MVTPLSARDALDVAGLERLIEHIVAGGVNGLFILGTSGEAPGLSYRLRRELVERTCRQVRGRLPVLVGITDTSFVDAIAMAALAADSGARAVVSAAPFYLPTAQPELIDYVERLVLELLLPLYLYNMPHLTKVPFGIETPRRLTGFNQIVGVKDSSGDLARVEELQRQVLQLDQIYSVGRHASAVIKGVKCACSLLGLCDDRMAEPFERFHEPERARVRAVLASLNLLPPQSAAS